MVKLPISGHKLTHLDVMGTFALLYVDGIHPKSSKFVRGVKTKVMGDSELNDTPSIICSMLTFACVSWVTSLSSHHALSLSSELTDSTYHQTKPVDNTITLMASRV